MSLSKAAAQLLRWGQNKEGNIDDLGLSEAALKCAAIVVQVGLAVVRCVPALRQRRDVVWFWWSVHRRGLLNSV